MGKKGTKRKTRWRTLSITECPDEGNSETNGGGRGGPGSRSSRGTVAYNTTDMSVAGASSLDENLQYSATNTSYVKRKPSSYYNRNTNTSPSNRRNDHRNSFNNHQSDNNYNYYQNKHNNTNNRGSSSSSIYSSRHPSSYRRRPFSQQNQQQQYGTNNTKYYSSYGAGRATSRAAYYRATDTATTTTTTTRTLDNSNKDNADEIKPFNDDDYTRISTPRQDVVFKKGYLSQPKKYLSSTDTNTTSSAAASIISAEESMSATSVPSLSPEQCSSRTDSFDPETAFLYSYIDQNGFFCVNPYLPNNQFDQYGSQVYMMPYPYPPYGMSSTDDAASPTLSSGSGSDKNRSSVDSTENSSDLNNSEGCDKNVKSPTENGDDPLSDQDTTSNPNEEKDVEEKNVNDPEKSGEEKTVTEENATATAVNPYIYDYGYPYFQPIFYPFMYPPEYIPVEDVDGDENAASKEICDVGIEEQSKPRFKRRRRPTNEINSTDVSATTTDYSEDGLSDDDVEVTITPADAEEKEAKHEETPIDKPEAERIPEIKKTDITNSTLNGNVKEFVPRENVKYVKKKLNVDVKEFIPRNYKPNRDIVENVPPTLETSQSPEEDGTQQLSENKDTSEKSCAEEDKKGALTNPSNPVEEPKESKSKRVINKQKDRQFIKEKPIQSSIGTATFADKIKSNLSDGFKDDTSSQINRLKPSVTAGRSNRNQNRKKSIGKSTAILQPASPVNEEIKVTIKNESQNIPSYAQMLNKSSSTVVVVMDETKPLINSPSSSSTCSSSPNQSKTPTKETMGKNREPICNGVVAEGLSKANANDNTTSDLWQTVKPRGKRGKLFKDVISVAEEEDSIKESRSIENVNKFDMNGVKKLEEIGVVESSNVKDLVSNNTKKMLSNTETENTSKIEDISSADTTAIKTSTPVSDKKKQPKQKNKKTPNKNKQTTPPTASNKKINKGFALIEPEFVSSSSSSSLSTEKTENRKSNNTNHYDDASLTDKHDVISDNSEQQQEDETDSAGEIYNSSINEQNISFDQLYPLQRTSPLMGKGFRHSHLNMINGFDYKFKDSSLLIKEEEEMVLSVIKSLSTSHSGKSSSSDNESDENCNNQLTNGDGDLTSDSLEDFDDRTLVQSSPDIIDEAREINNSKEMKGETESYESDTVSDLSPDECFEIKVNRALNNEVVETSMISENMCNEQVISTETKNENIIDTISRVNEIPNEDSEKILIPSKELEISTTACLEIDSSDLKTTPTNSESHTVPNNEFESVPNYGIDSIPEELIDTKTLMEENKSSSRDYIPLSPEALSNLPKVIKKQPRKEVEIFWDIEDVQPQINENNGTNSNEALVPEILTSSELDVDTKKKTGTTSTINLENKEINGESTKDLSQVECELFDTLDNLPNGSLSAIIEQINNDKIETIDEKIIDELLIINKNASEENHIKISEEIIQNPNEDKSNLNKIDTNHEEEKEQLSCEKPIKKSNENHLSSNNKDDITTKNFKSISNDTIISVLDKNKKSSEKMITLNDNCENITNNTETMSYIESKDEYGKDRGKANIKVRRILKNLHNNNAAQVLNNISEIVTQKNELLSDKIVTASDDHLVNDHCSKENIINCSQVNIRSSISPLPSQCNQNDQLIFTAASSLSTENGFVAQKSDNGHKLIDENLINIDVKKTEMFNGSIKQSLFTNKENVTNSNLCNNESSCRDIACGSSKTFNMEQLNDLANDHFPKYIQNDYIEHQVYELKLGNNNVNDDISQLNNQFEKLAESNIKDQIKDNIHVLNQLNDLVRKVDMDNIKDHDKFSNLIGNKLEEPLQQHVTNNFDGDINKTECVHYESEKQIEKLVIEESENSVTNSNHAPHNQIPEQQIKDHLSKHEEYNIFPQIYKAEITPQDQFLTSKLNTLQQNPQYHKIANITNLSAHETEPKDAKNPQIYEIEFNNKDLPQIENQISSSIAHPNDDEKSTLLTPPLDAQKQSDSNCTITNKANSAPGEMNNKRASSLPPPKDSIKNTSCDIMPYSNNPIKQNSTENLTNNSSSSSNKSDSINFMTMPPLKTPSSSSSLRDVRNADNSQKFPLTQAVLQWLNEETKEKTPEPILRIPDDPILSTFIESSIKQQHTQPHNAIPPDDEHGGGGGGNNINFTGEEYADDSVSDESDVEEESKSTKNSKNLKSNPSHVSSVNRLNLRKGDKAQNSHYTTVNNNNLLLDNDSDYNSDSQQRNDDDKYTCERVAYQPSDNILEPTIKIQRTGSNNNNNNQQVETINDLLDFWDDDFMKNPQKWLKPTAIPESTNRCSISADRESTASSTNNLEPYESVYGKSIDYKRLFESKKEFLSNNIISFNDNKNTNNKILNSNHNNNNNINNNIHQTSLNNDNFDNNKKLNDNCLKPPEVCCILM